MVHSCIIPFASVHANSDGDLLAWPSIRPAFLVATAKSAHDTGVVGSDAISILVEIMKSETKAFDFKQPGHSIVH